MKSKTNSKTLLLTMVSVTIAFFVYKIFSVLTNNLTINYFILMTIREVVFFAAALAVTLLLHKTKIFQLKFKGLGNGLMAGMFFIILSILSIQNSITETMSAGGPTIQLWEMILLVVIVILVGINEELLFRGLLLNSFHEFFGEDSVGAVKKAFVFTGIFFGFLHIFNIFTGAPVINTLIQVVVVSPLGMMFAAIYYRSGKNLWLCALIHAVYDFSGFLSGKVLLGVTTEEESTSFGVYYSLILAAIIFLIFLFISRKKKLQPLIEKQQSQS